MEARRETHIPLCTTPSSNKIRAASVAYKVSSISDKPSTPNTVRLKTEETFAKNQKPNSKIHDVPVMSDLPPKHQRFEDKYLENNHVVFDGSNPTSKSTISLISSHKLKKPIQIINLSSSRDILIPKDIDNRLGIKYLNSKQEVLFCLCPRVITLKSTKLYCMKENAIHLFNSFSAIEEVHKHTLKRGLRRPVFGSAKYVGALGWHQNRAGTGLCKSYHYHSNINRRAIDCVEEYISRLEDMMLAYSNPESVSMLFNAKKLVQWPTMDSCRFYSSVAFGKNIYLPAHKDQDFTFSITSIHKRSANYDMDDSVLAYFCFPKISVAIPMKPGDVIIFNPQEYHCVSSRSNEDDVILCVSVYLKSAIVGGHDNGQILSPKVKNVLSLYKNKI